MSKKSIIICVSIIGIFLIIICAALYFLYSGTGRTRDSLAENREYMLFTAVPSDADAVLKCRNFSTMLSCLVSDGSSVSYFVTGRKEPGKFAAFLRNVSDSSSLYSSLMASPAVVSIHNIGVLTPLLVIDADRSGEPESSAVKLMLDNAAKAGMTAVYSDAADYAPAGSPLRKRSLLLVSPSDVLVDAALRHLKAEVSVLDLPGFPEAVSGISSDNILVLPSGGVRRIASEIFSSKCSEESASAAGFADCTAFSIDRNSSDGFTLSGNSYSDGSLSNIMEIYSGISPASSEVSSVLPSYAISAVSVPMADVEAYLEAYLKYAQTKSLVKEIEAGRAALKKKTGIDPVEWASALDIKEVSSACFTAGGKPEKILLARLGHPAWNLLVKGIKDAPETKSEDRILPYRYSGFLAALFGKQFSAADESSFILHGDWIIAGSRGALSEYVSGRALEYSLSDFMADAAVEDRLSCRNAYFVSYLSLTEDADFISSVFSPDFIPAVKASAEGITYEPVFFTIEETKSGLVTRLSADRTTVLKSQAPTFERDTSVVIPKGPFRVKNSGTGKWNLFYQQDNMYLCLQEEGGKGLWGVPFDAPICGCARTVDFYANGKLQILFASGTKLYLIDRLGRFVNTFPVDIGKQVLLGPDVYDFSGNKKYNVMILHTDNTIEMYNLQGRRPPQWKTITASETIKGLPERIKVGGNTFWVVRTSIQTLVFGFYGGEPLTVFSGDRMIRPDSEVVPSGDDSVEVVCYDGKKRTVKIK